MSFDFSHWTGDRWDLQAWATAAAEYKRARIEMEQAAEEMTRRERGTMRHLTEHGPTPVTFAVGRTIVSAMHRETATVKFLDHLGLVLDREQGS